MRQKQIAVITAVSLSLVVFVLLAGVPRDVEAALPGGHVHVVVVCPPLAVS